MAVEAASGALSRAFASPGVVGAAWVQECLSPAVLAQMGRDLIRSGDSMHVMRRGADGMVRFDSGFVLALRRLARSGDVDRARNGLRAEHFDDLESVGVCCSAPNFDPMDSNDVNRSARRSASNT